MVTFRHTVPMGRAYYSAWAGVMDYMVVVAGRRPSVSLPELKEHGTVAVIQVRWS